MRVEALTRTLQGDPTNDAVVDELSERLTRLGRSMELLALLSARLEDAPPERREELLPRHHAALERLEQEARAAGRDGEADLFKMARDVIVTGYGCRGSVGGYWSYASSSLKAGVVQLLPASALLHSRQQRDGADGLGHRSA